jgi:hypothetical protein
MLTFDVYPQCVVSVLAIICQKCWFLPTWLSRIVDHCFFSLPRNGTSNVHRARRSVSALANRMEGRNLGADTLGTALQPPTGA